MQLHQILINWWFIVQLHDRVMQLLELITSNFKPEQKVYAIIQRKNYVAVKKFKSRRNKINKTHIISSNNRNQYPLDTNLYKSIASPNITIKDSPY